jgi:hypothetical protein
MITVPDIGEDSSWHTAAAYTAAACTVAACMASCPACSRSRSGRTGSWSRHGSWAERTCNGEIDHGSGSWMMDPGLISPGS